MLQQMFEPMDDFGNVITLAERIGECPDKREQVVMTIMLSISCHGGGSTLNAEV